MDRDGGTETAGPGARGLRAARLARGWSQADAARELAGLAARRGARDPRAGSLKTQLSRWENEHATPSPEHRALLAELYGSTPAGLGLEPAGPAADRDGGARLRAALARAAAVGPGETALLTEQLRVTADLGERLGPAAADDVLAAQVAQLRDLLVHCVHPARARELAGLLAGAALRAGDRERESGAPDRAWLSYGVADDAARRSGRDDVTGAVRDRRARLLREYGSDSPGAHRRGAGADDPHATPPGAEGRAPHGAGDAPVRVDRQGPPTEVDVEIGHGAHGRVP
ncbi:helix-turn-helix transcriptional regulator [Pseudonocardia nematodicida]|uniref:Helix-turn-helix transcriptional regulator n=1 Tax=Pseudonocardia nematodicida TaxID=1206997 RepID=A0ABV1K313_9PSEU